MDLRKVVIPVAGSGSRLLPVTKTLPKEMLPVGRKTAVQYVVEEALAAGLRQVLFVTGKQKAAIEDHFHPEPAFDQRVASPKGPGEDDRLQERSEERRVGKECRSRWRRAQREVK